MEWTDIENFATKRESVVTKDGVQSNHRWVENTFHLHSILIPSVPVHELNGMTLEIKEFNLQDTACLAAKM